MWRSILSVFLTVTLFFTTVACQSSPNTPNNQANFTNNTGIKANNLSDGKYPVQQATYNDVNGEYNVMILNNPVGTSPVFRTENLQMARLTDEEVKNGEKTYLNVNGKDASMHLAEDFKIEYIHNETQEVTNANTGQKETVIVRQQSSFWSPFAGALAGQALGSMLFRPQYYVPPMYQPGGNLTGFGGYGSSYNQAVTNYQSNYNSPPAAVKNRNTFRTTGSLRNNTNKANTTTNKSKNTRNNTKATGSGFGSSNLKTKGNSGIRQPSNSSFGTKRSNTRTPSRGGSFGSRRRR